MRVISQNSTREFPYEDFTFSIESFNDCWNIVVHYGMVTAIGGNIIARYLTKEKAIMAMEMLRAKYRESKLKYCLMIGNIKEGFSEEIMKDMLSCVYFKFPKDDEVEV